jgi:sec-independent protein translocase protein TatB
MLVIACVAIIVVGPKELPGMLRAIGKSIGKIKRMAGDFQRQVDDAIKEADLDDIKDIASNKTFAPLDDAKKSMEEFTKTMQDPLEAHKSVVNDELDAPVKVAKTASKAAAKKTSTKKAAPKKPAAKTVSKPAPKKTAAKKPAAKKPAPKRVAAKKPATAKSAS